MSIVNVKIRQNTLCKAEAFKAFEFCLSPYTIDDYGIGDNDGIDNLDGIDNQVNFDADGIDFDLT